jgi:hypothetical protein
VHEIKERKAKDTSIKGGNMSFATRLKNSWHLFTQSLTVMRDNKKLMAFPLVTAALTLLIILFFIVPVTLQPTGYKYTDIQHWKAVAKTVFTAASIEAPQTGDRRSSPKLTNYGFIFFAIIYFAAMFLATFFSVAFYHEILRALNGQDVSISGGLRFAATKIPSIFIWSLFAGLVGYIIRTLEEKVGIIGKIILSIIGIAWSVAAVFVIPFIVTDASLNPLHLLQESAVTLKKTWGESLIGYLGIQFGSLIIALSSLLLLGGVLIIAIQLHSIFIFLAVCALWLIGILAFSYLMNIANHIYRCALFVFASAGKVPAPFDQTAMQSAWKMKR